MLGTPQGVHDIALKEQDFSLGNGPYPTECLIMASNRVNVKAQPFGKLLRGNASPKLFFKKCGHGCPFSSGHPLS